ncbi:MAG: HAD hydrolase-like protein [Actinobacteria bacterium]|nr:HAD hydrolase-like protein [Actinomycetota bacterium]
MRRSFQLVGLDDLIDVFVLSFELVVEKPDLALFRQACKRMQISPMKALMVGDDPLRDGAAVEVGIPVFLLPKVRRPQHPRGLSHLLSLTGGEHRTCAPEGSGARRE